MSKKEIETTAIETVSAETAINAVNMTVDDFLSFVTSSLAVSPLAVGTKFESDNLVNADSVTLYDCDIVEYHDSTKDEEVRFAVWTVEADGERGYYQGGIVLTQLADNIIKANALDELRNYGIPMSFAWSKTKGGQKMIQVTVKR